MSRAPVHGYRADVAPAPEAEQPDRYQDKLAKYIPGEVVAGFVGLVALAKAAIGDLPTVAWSTHWPIFLAAAAGLIATPCYLYLRSSANPDEITRLYSYVLAAIAFIPWALLVSQPLRDTVGVGEPLAGFLVALAAFTIPMIDSMLSRRTAPDASSDATVVPTGPGA